MPITAPPCRSDSGNSRIVHEKKRMAAPMAAIGTLTKTTYQREGFSSKMTTSAGRRIVGAMIRGAARPSWTPSGDPDIGRSSAPPKGRSSAAPSALARASGLSFSGIETMRAILARG